MKDGILRKSSEGAEEEWLGECTMKPIHCGRNVSFGSTGRIVHGQSDCLFEREQCRAPVDHCQIDGL